MNHYSYYKKYRYGILYAIIFLLMSFTGCAKGTQAKDKKTYHIAIMHSYEETNPQYPEFNKHLVDYFYKKGINIETSFFYLDCEQYDNNEELERCRDYMDSIKDWNPDVILTVDDQVTYSLSVCGHPLVRQIPIVFTGVIFPNWKVLKSFTNITGIWDKPDYLKNVEMVEELLGKTRIRFFHDNTYLGKEVIREISIQLKERDPYTAMVLTDFLQSNDSVVTQLNFARDASTKEEYSQRPDSTLFYFTNLRDEKGRDVLWAISGYVKHAVFVITKYDYRTMRVGRMASIPVFSVINEGVGYDYGILGGYMSTLEDQAKEQVEFATRILNGEAIKNIPIKTSEKKFVVDYEELQHWKIPTSSVPDNYKILNMPYRISHPFTFWGIISIIIACISFFIIYPLYLYFRESKRKKEANRNYRREKETLSYALEGSNIYVWRYNEQTDEFTYDKEFFDSLKIPSQMFSMKQMSTCTHPEDRQNALDAFIKVKNKIVTEKTVIYRCDFNRKGYRWYEQRYISPTGELAKTSTVIGLIKDIQEYKEKEEELIAARDLAAQAELKQSFLANMSHEIRTPLNAIVGFSNILASDEDLPSEERNEYINTININCELLLKLINDILEISRIESGNMTFAFAPCNISVFVEEMYKTHSLLIPSHIDFRKNMPDGTVIINTDSARLSQVVTNFLNNATKFTPEGYIELGCIINDDTKEISIYVEDSGKGIPPEEQKMIFERFYKQDEFAQGTGLGLSISMIIADKLGGRITLQSEIGKGSRFTIILPY